MKLRGNRKSCSNSEYTWISIFQWQDNYWNLYMYCAMSTKNNWRLCDLLVTQPCWTLLLCKNGIFCSEVVSCEVIPWWGWWERDESSFKFHQSTQKQQYLEEHVERFGFFQHISLIHGMKKDLTNNSGFLCRRCPHSWQGLEGEECQGPFQPKPCWGPVTQLCNLWCL